MRKTRELASGQDEGMITREAGGGVVQGYVCWQAARRTCCKAADTPVRESRQHKGEPRLPLKSVMLCSCYSGGVLFLFFTGQRHASVSQPQVGAQEQTDCFGR